MKRLLSIFYLMGFATVLFALSMGIPAAVSLYADESSFSAFRDGFLFAFALGAVVLALTRREQRELQARDGFVLVALVWTVLPLIASVPLWLYFARAGAPISFTHAYFEAMSGLTTTGSTVLTGLEHLPASINVWRATLMWIGGMGILVLAVAILPLLGVGGSQVVRAETPGPMKDEKLTPRIASTAKGLYAIYLGLSALCAAAYYLAGLRGTDLYVHMAATVSLGGFSTADQSIAAFDSPMVELVAISFMLISGINFATHFSALRARSLQPYRYSVEAPYFLALCLCVGLAVSTWLYWQQVYADYLDALRYGMFNTISVVTTTGFANTDYASWPIFAPLVMLLFSCFTASSGSTGGGLKLIRVILMVKQARYELLRLVHPKAIAPILVARRIVDQRVLLGILAFFLLYITSLTAIALLLVFTGLDTLTAFTAALSSLNNTGPGLGMVGPAGSYADMTAVQTWVCTFAMLLGRLELITILVLFTPAFWRR